MRLRIVLAILLISIPLSEASARRYQPETEKIVRHIPLHAAAGISISGTFDVSLHTGYAKHPEIRLYGSPKDLQKVIVLKKGDLIQLDMNKKFRGIVRAEIRSNQLKRFSYSGSGVITGNKMHAKALTLYIKNKGRTMLRGTLGLRELTVVDSGLTLLDGVKSDFLRVKLAGNSRVQLTGVANLAHLETEGKGWLGMYWIKSHALTVRGNQTQIQLGGIVNFLDVDIRGNGWFKGRYLRADTAFVKTHDTATAELTALRRQHTLALDKSDIYFYNIADFRTDFMGDDGAVLDMRSWHEYAMKDYTIYNK